MLNFIWLCKIQKKAANSGMCEDYGFEDNKYEPSRRMLIAFLHPRMVYREVFGIYHI